MLRRVLACVTLWLLGCDVPVETAPPPQETVAVPSATDAATAKAAPVPASIPSPAGFVAYDAEMDAKCPDTEKGFTQAGFKPVTERLTWLLTEGRALGSAFCDAAPELQTALGSECPSLTSNYLFSFAQSLGDTELLDGW
jgi:hypothetical protein